MNTCWEAYGARRSSLFKSKRLAQSDFASSKIIKSRCYLQLVCLGRVWNNRRGRAQQFGLKSRVDFGCFIDISIRLCHCRLQVLVVGTDLPGNSAGVHRRLYCSAVTVAKHEKDFNPEDSNSIFEASDNLRYHNITGNARDKYWGQSSGQRQVLKIVLN